MQLKVDKYWINNHIYYLIVFYYLIISYFPSVEVDKFSIKYFLYIIPVIFFIGFLSPQLAIRKYDKKSILSLILLLSVIIVSIIRLDISTIFSIFLFSATLIAIFNSKVSPSIEFINFLFILTIFGSVIAYHFGLSEFGYVPSFADMKGFISGSIGWRISLFPLVTESGFFALLVIITNYFLNPNRSRYLFYALGLYFLIFSGSRTSLVIFSFFIVFIVISHFFMFRERTLYKLLNLLMISVFILLLSFKSLLLLIKDTRIGFLNEYIFRTEEGLQEETKLQDVATRSWLWEQHLRIYAKSPIFGVGTYDFNSYKDKVTKSYQNSSGSESFITSLLARVGLLALLVVGLLYTIQKQAMKNRNQFVYVLSLFIFMTMISYGSFMVAYNFMFLLLFGLVNNKAY